MPRPKHIGFDLADDLELPTGKDKDININLKSGDTGGHKTGIIVRVFTKANGLPTVTVLVQNETLNGATPGKKVTVKPRIEGEYSVRVIAWDKKTFNQGGREVHTRKLRFKSKRSKD